MLHIEFLLLNCEAYYKSSANDNVISMLYFILSNNAGVSRAQHMYNRSRIADKVQ